MRKIGKEEMKKRSEILIKMSEIQTKYKMESIHLRNYKAAKKDYQIKQTEQKIVELNNEWNKLNKKLIILFSKNTV